ERLRDDERHLGLEVRGELTEVDDVDVGLGELPEPALLGTLAAPDLLDMIAPEREGQPAGVLEDVARERHGEVEVESELAVAGVLAARCEPAHGIGLLVGVATLADEAVDRLNRPRLDGGESMQLEHLTDGVEE